MRKISLSHKESKRIRLIALLSSTIAHFLLFSVLFLLIRHVPGFAHLMDLDWRGGGGGGGLKIYEIEFGPQSGNQTETTEDIYRTEKFTVSRIKIEDFSNQGTPVIHVEKPKKEKKKKKREVERLFGANLPTKHRRGSGPGSGGGMGGGSGGGIGKSSGYSIDWGGMGSRNLLSGSLPRYPEGTTKEMAVALQFSVLPDGSVSSVIPLRKSDELLERAAISALRTWRFDPLPSQYEQKTQVGKVTFNFKLE
ncbi:MAG: energy transducer TonB [Bacteroidota bacterium]